MNAIRRRSVTGRKVDGESDCAAYSDQASFNVLDAANRLAQDRCGNAGIGKFHSSGSIKQMETQARSVPQADLAVYEVS